VQDHAVAGIVVVLVCILSNGAGPHLPGRGWGGGGGDVRGDRGEAAPWQLRSGGPEILPPAPSGCSV
jgi:hypothetical protein